MKQLTKKEAETKFAVNELIRINAQLEVLKEEESKYKKVLESAHPHQPGEPVLIRSQPHTLKYLFVRYTDGIPAITENFTRLEWDSEKKEFNEWSPVSPANVEYLEPLSEEELDRLMDLNYQGNFGNVDSRTEASKLEQERDELRKRCGHKWKDTSPIFNSLERRLCEKCGWETRSDDDE